MNALIHMIKPTVTQLSQSSALADALLLEKTLLAAKAAEAAHLQAASQSDDLIIDLDAPSADEIDDADETDSAPDLFEHTKVVETVIVDEQYGGLRFDQVAATVFDAYSRERLKNWMLEGKLTVDGKPIKPKNRANGGEVLHLEVELEVETSHKAQDIPLEIVYEDDDIIVINKPVGLVVHPGAGHRDGTLINGLLFHCPQLKELPRAGLVHRIDKDTSGLLVVAKNLPAQHNLSQQLESKSVYRVYDAVVMGHVIAGGTINEPIRRHSVDRTRMSVSPGGRPSVTHYRVRERYGHHTLLKVQLETGRTHQIRVHMSHMQLPLVGDTVYGGGRLRLPRGASPELVAMLKSFQRQALHARELGLVHPITGEDMLFSAPWPTDFTMLVNTLRREVELHPDL